MRTNSSNPFQLDLFQRDLFERPSAELCEQLSNLAGRVKRWSLEPPPEPAPFAGLYVTASLVQSLADRMASRVTR